MRALHVMENRHSAPPSAPSSSRSPISTRPPAAFSLKVASQIFIRGDGIVATGRLAAMDVKKKAKPNTYYKTPTMRVEGGWVGVHTRSRAAARATVRFLSHQCTVAGRPHRAGQLDCVGSGSATAPTSRVRRLSFSAQSPDEPIGGKLWRGVRVVAAGAAGAGALFSGAHVVFGQMMAPDARTEHSFGRPSARTGSESAHPKRG